MILLQDRDDTQRGFPLASFLGMLARSALLAAALVQAAMLLVAMAFDIAHPFPVSYAEGAVLDRALAVARGASLYTPMNQPPFTTCVFTPFYVRLCGLAAVWIGPSYAFGRALSALANLVSGGLLYVLVRRELGEEHPRVAGRRWALIAALLFLGSRLVARDAAVMRPDTLGITFDLAGLTVAACGLSPVLAGLLVGLALLCKQSLLAGVLAIGFGFAAARRWRSLALAAGTCVLVAGMGCVAEQIGSHGWFLRHAVTATATGWSFERAWMHITMTLARYAILALLGLGGLLLARRKGEPESARGREVGFRPGLAYLLATAVVAPLVGKPGSSFNYLLELVAALCLLGVVGAARLEARLDRRGIGAVPPCLLLLVYLWQARWLAPVDTYYPHVPGEQAVVRAMAEARGPVLCEEMGLVPLAGKPLWFAPFEYTQMAAAGTWDQTPLVNAIRAGEFPVIVLRFDPADPRFRDREGTWAGGRFTDEMVAAIRASYHETEHYYHRRVFRPNEAAPADRVR